MVTRDEEEADALVILTCTVKTPTQNKVVKRIRELHVKGIPLVVAGCMPKAQKSLVMETAPGASLIGPDNLRDIVSVVEAVLEGCVMETLSEDIPDRTCLPRLRKNPVVHIAPISSGCLGDCSYCIVKRARGHLTSYPAVGILEDIAEALKEGCREIWITAEDTAAYQWEGVTLPQLLSDICNLKGDFRIRVGMMTPNQALPIIDELLHAFASEKIFKFLHVPVQSGNDAILRKMRRRYTRSDFIELVDCFREVFPSSSLSTDIICGFPGESEEQFNDSLELLKEVKPDVLNISRFWGRPGTEAASMVGQLHGRVTKQRSRKLSEIWREKSLEWNRRWLGWEGKVLIDELGRTESVVGRNSAYKPVVLTYPLDIGKFVDVKIVETRGSYLIGSTQP
jgi:MiaB-like tRNA modifying enzyme